MKQIFSFRTCCLILAGPLISALSVYLILSNLLLFPSDTAVTLSVILFALLIGLSSYLLIDGNSNNKNGNELAGKKGITNLKGNLHNGVDIKKISAANLFYIALYIFSIIIVGTSEPVGTSKELFISWDQISPIHLVQLCAAILLTFFLPGYTFAYLLLRTHLEPLPKMLLSILLSMLLSGFTVYITEIMIGVPLGYLNQIIIGVNILVLIIFIIYQKKKESLSVDFQSLKSRFLQPGFNFKKILTIRNSSVFIIFASLFSLVIFYTYYLDKGVIVGDQWFHHGRALLINTGTFKELGTSHSDRFYSPFFSAVLAGLFNLSGAPTVNAYASIHLLNMLPILAFYYFFSRWVPSLQGKGAALATVLFVLSSGFGWILVLNSSFTNDYQYSQQSTIENLHWASVRSSDIRTPTTFINVGHPTFSSPLIIIGLPAGFLLLGLLKENFGNHSKLRFICIIAAITILGIVAHPEFYLFILVASIIIVSFHLRYGNLSYASIVLALLVCAILDFLSPQNYYTSIRIFYAPLLILTIVFVSALWGLYASRILTKLYAKFISHSFSFGSLVKPRYKKGIKIFLVCALAYFYLFSFIVLGYLSNNDIQLQVGTSTQRNIPWYLYPIKFGICGLLGLAFLISYMFRRFEKEIFVFGVIALIALLTGPYYDEHRLGKYVMVGMVGFASILLYKIIMYLLPHRSNAPHSHTITTLKALTPSILLGAIVTMASLSVFMLAGYKELAYGIPQLQEDFYRVNFPSQSEMNLLNIFRAISPYLKTGLVAIEANDTQTENLLSKLTGFSAIPESRILQNPRALNASTLEGLYSSLEKQNIKYIIFLKKDLNQKEHLSKPIDFILDNFPRVNTGDTYFVLKVPDLKPPSSEGKVDVGLIYNKRDELPPLSTILYGTNNNYSKSSNDTIPQYNYKFFDNVENKSQFVKIEKKGNKIENGTFHSENESKSGLAETLTLYGDKRPRTLWSGPIKVPGKVNYVEGKFRLIAENKTRNDFGVKLEDDMNKQEYYASIDKNSLDLKQRSNLDNLKNRQLILSENRQLIPEQRGLWHTLKILVLNNTMEVYLDDTLNIKIPKTIGGNISNFNTISKIGITANNNIVEFEPLKIGYLPDSLLKTYKIRNVNETYLHYFYPLTALALSKLGYDSYLDGDSSVFSKRNVILPSDPKLSLETDNKSMINGIVNQSEQEISQEEFNKYLEYVKSGGTLIVLNEHDTDKNNIGGNESEKGAFSKFLAIHYGDKVQFNGIIDNAEYKSVNKSEDQNEVNGFASNKTRLSHQNFINISGLTTNLDFDNSSDIYVKSYYANINPNKDYNTIAPFAVEKKYGEGRIILLNIAGYFDSIFRSKNKAFDTIADLPKLIDLNSDKYQNRHSENMTVPAQEKIADNMKILNSNEIDVKSNSLLLGGVNGKTPSFNLTLNKITISPQTTINVNGGNYSSFQDKYGKLEENALSNIKIRDLKLYGPYQVIINSTDKDLSLFPTLSHYDYLALSVPVGFDTTLKLFDDAYAEFTGVSCSNNVHCPQTIRISGDGEIFLHKIRADSPLVTYLPVLVKSPEIRILNGSVNLDMASDNRNPSQDVGNFLAKGNITTDIDYVENYGLPNNNNITKLDSSVYLKLLNINGTFSNETENHQKGMLRLPGEISERAILKGIEIPWQRALISPSSIIVIILIIATVIAIGFYILPRLKYRKLHE